MARTITKEVKHTIEDKEMTFQITKMNALEASYLLKFVIEKLMPLFASLENIMGGEIKEGDDPDAVAKQRTQQVLTLIPQVLSTLSEEELNTLIKKCLKTVEALMPAGWQPVMIGDNFGVEELEYDVMTSLVLCYEVIDFNTESFFGGKNLSSFLSKRNS